MRVGIDVGKLSEFPSGISYYISELIRGLARNKIDLVLFTNRDCPLEIPGRLLRNHKKGRGFYLQHFIPKEIEKNKIDIFHQPANTGLPILTSIPKILTVHDLIPLEKNYFSNSKHPFLSKQKYILAQRLNFKKAKKIIVDSEHTREVLLENFPGINSQKVTKIYLSGNHNNQKNDAVLKELNLSKTQFILNNGGIADRKNINELIEAFLIVRKNNPNIKLVITGKKIGFNKFINKKYIEYIKKREIILSGPINSKKMKSLLVVADCLCYTSSSEGFGMPILEAFNSNTPTVISDIPVFREISNSTASLFFNPREPKDIARKVEITLNDKEKRKDMIKEGNRIAKNFSWDKTVKETISVYKSCLE